MSGFYVTNNFRIASPIQNERVQYTTLIYPMFEVEKSVAVR